MAESCFPDFNNTGRVLALIDAGADIDAKGKDGNTMLIRAVHKAELMAELVQRGANLESTGNKGQTALHQTVYKGRPICATLLLDNGANPEAKDRQEHTTHVGSEFGLPAMCTLPLGARCHRGRRMMARTHGPVGRCDVWLDILRSGPAELPRRN
jgi:Ankyrin repeats (3 copies)